MITARRDVLWGAAALSCAPVIVFGSNGTVLLLVLLALALPGFAPWRAAVTDALKTPIGIALAALALLAALSLLWTVDPADAAQKLARLGLLWIAGHAAVTAAGTLDGRTLRRFAWVLPACVALAILFYWEELLSSAWIKSQLSGAAAAMRLRFSNPLEQEFHRQLFAFTAIGRGAALLAIFVWPAMACLNACSSTYGKWLSGALCGALFVTALQLPLGAAPFAIATGGIAFVLSYLAPQRGPRLLMALAIVSMGAMPLIAQNVARPEVLGIEKRDLPPSWQHRIEIWHYTAEKIAARPLTGWGFDAARHLGDGSPQFVVEQPDGSGITYPGIGLLPLHPHNAILQIWLELGAAGALAAMLLLFGLGRKLAAIGAACGRMNGALATASVASALSILVLSFGLWQSWWQASLWLAAALWAASLAYLNPR